MVRARTCVAVLVALVAVWTLASCTPEQQALLEQTVATASVWTSTHPEVEQWHQVALDAGWPESDWRWLACVMWRESRGDPGAYNGRGRDRSYGLMQLNMRAHAGWVGPLVGGDFARLFEPSVNLAVARQLLDAAGRSPWSTRRRSC